MTFDAELSAAIAAVREAGEEAARMRGEGLRYGRKAGWELVSEADIRVAEMLHGRLAAAFPGVGWLSEEHTDTTHRLGCDRIWVVDPIDGTREYLQGLPEYAVSVGLAVEGVPALGVVYNPATGEMFAAVSSGAPVRKPGLVPPSFEVVVGRGEHELDEVPPLPAGARTRGVGSVAYRLALVAAGKADAVVSMHGRAEWDVAAGVALCLAAGIPATDVLGGELRFNQPGPYVRGLLAARPALHTHIRMGFGRGPR